MSSRMASKRKATVPSKSKATAATTTRAVAAASGAAASRVPRGSGSAPAPNLVGLSNSATAAFVGRGSSSSPAPNPSATSIHPQSMGDGFNSSPIHGRQGYPVGFGVDGSISPSSPPFGHQSSWDPTWDNNTHPPGGFMGLFNNQPHLSQNSHFVGAPSHYTPFKAPQPNNCGSSSQEVEVLSDQEAIEVDSDIENVRTEKRIMWTPEEDEKLMSAWLKNSTDSSVGADRNNEHYWGDVVKSYNMTIPSQRKRNSKQAKDRWHKINRWTDLYECAYLKARWNNRLAVLAFCGQQGTYC